MWFVDGANSLILTESRIYILWEDTHKELLHSGKRKWCLCWEKAQKEDVTAVIRNVNSRTQSWVARNSSKLLMTAHLENKHLRNNDAKIQCSDLSFTKEINATDLTSKKRTHGTNQLEEKRRKISAECSRCVRSPGNGGLALLLQETCCFQQLPDPMCKKRQVKRQPLPMLCS